jgi:flagellar biosynthesis/type III secretory pathway protein FliH
MTSLIKRGEFSSGAIRALAPSRLEEDFLLEQLADEAPAPFRDPELSALERRAAALERELEETRASLASRIEAARTEGRQEAALAHKRDDAKALATLEAAAKSSLERLDERLVAIEAFALLMSETALQKVFAGAQDFRDLMSRAVKRQVDQLRAETVLGVNVSASDFPDEASLQKLAASLGAGRVAIARDAKLPRGEARIDLRLGRIELSLPEHWASLQTLLRSLPGSGQS